MLAGQGRDVAEHARAGLVLLYRQRLLQRKPGPLAQAFRDAVGAADIVREEARHLGGVWRHIQVQVPRPVGQLLAVAHGVHRHLCGLGHQAANVKLTGALQLRHGAGRARDAGHHRARLLILRRGVQLSQGVAAVGRPECGRHQAIHRLLRRPAILHQHGIALGHRHGLHEAQHAVRARHAVVIELDRRQVNPARIVGRFLGR